MVAISRGLSRIFPGLALSFGVACGDDPQGAPSTDAVTPEADAVSSLDARAAGGGETVRPDRGVDLDADTPLDVPTERPDGGRRAEVQPTPRPADLPGADDLTQPVPAGRARAGRVDVDAERLTGPEANCRVGDYRLDNGLIQTCIQDADTFSIFSFAGGTLIDAHRADRPGTDLLLEVLFSPGLGATSVERIGIVRDGADGGPAILRVDGRATASRLLQGVLPGTFVPPDLAVTTEYTVAPDSDSIQIDTWVEADVTGGTALLADAVFFGDRTFSFLPNRKRDDRPVGDLPWIAAEGLGVAYRFERDGGPLQVIPLPANELPLNPVTYGTQSLFVGDQFHVRRRLIVGGDDVESIRPSMPGTLATVLTGPPGAWVGVTDAEGRFVTRARIDASGRRALQLPPGTWQWHLYDERTGPSGTFEAGGETALAVSAPGRVRVVAQDQNGQGIGVRVRLERDNGEVRLEFVVDDTTFVLPPGRWRAVTTRGWHFEVDEREFEVRPGEETRVDLTLQEVFPFEGWTSGEFHQHASPSMDSEVAIERRLLSNLTEGVGFMAPSEHDVVFDFRPVAERLGYSERIRILTGTEISPLYGHFGAYGLPSLPDEAGFGGIELPTFENGRWRVKRPPELVAAARARGAEILQINHARGATSSWFDHMNLVAGDPLELLDEQEFTRDFDTMEVFNDVDAFCALFQDWLGFWNQGWRITGIGNSDTHSEDRAPGYPRNYMPTLADKPEGVEPAEVFDALRAGRVIVGGGLLLDFPGNVGPGDTISASAGSLDLRLRVRSPSWSRADWIYVLVNGQLVVERAVDSVDEDLVDFDGTVEVPIPRDAWVVVLTTGQNLRYVASGRPTFAFSNPIGVDVDGGGVTPVGPGPVHRFGFGYCE